MTDSGRNDLMMEGRPESNWSQGSQRKILFAIIALAAILRFSLLVFDLQLPVIWDARRYTSAGIALISLLDSSGPESSPSPLEDRKAFVHYNNKWIDGEQIDWQYYLPRTLSQANDDMFFSGPLYPSLLALVFAVSPSGDLMVARVVGILLDLLALWLLVQIAARLIGKNGALVAGGIYAVYFPFVNTSTMLLLESSTTLLLLGAVFLLLRGTETEQKSKFVWAGVIMGLLLLNKPTAMLLAAPLLAALFFHVRIKAWPVKRYLKYVIYVVAPLFITFIGWLSVASLKYDQVTLRDPNYAGANLRQSASIEFEGYDLDVVDENEFWERQPYGQFFSKVPDYAGLFVKKFERLFSKPYNDFDRTLLCPVTVQKWFHSLLMVSGLMGLLWMVASHHRAFWWIALIAAYYIGIHVIFHSINRYSFNALPFLFLASAWVFVRLARSVSISKPNSILRVGLWSLFIFVGVAVDPSWRMHGTLTGVWMVIVIKLVLVWLGSRGLGVATGLGQSGVGRIAVPISMAFVMGLMVWSQSVARDSWAEFEVSLDNPEYRAGNCIYADSLFDPNLTKRLFVAVDINGLPTKQPSFDLLINGQQARFEIATSSQTNPGCYLKQVYGVYGNLMGLSIASFRQYKIFEMDPIMIQATLESVGYLDVAIRCLGDSEVERLLIHGQAGRSSERAWIPSIVPEHASVERFVDRRDPRIRQEVEFISDSTISYYIKKNSTDLPAEDNLDFEERIITGRFNIFLVQQTTSGETRIY